MFEFQSLLILTRFLTIFALQKFTTESWPKITEKYITEVDCTLESFFSGRAQNPNKQLKPVPIRITCRIRQRIDLESEFRIIEDRIDLFPVNSNLK